MRIGHVDGTREGTQRPSTAINGHQRRIHRRRINGDPRRSTILNESYRAVAEATSGNQRQLKGGSIAFTGRLNCIHRAAQLRAQGGSIAFTSTRAIEQLLRKAELATLSMNPGSAVDCESFFEAAVPS